jgi:hypothetical protein
MDRAKQGETVRVRTAGFASSDDSNWYLAVMNATPSLVLSQHPDVHQRFPPTVHTLLAIFDSTGKGTAYLNELVLTAMVQTKTSIKKGQAIGKDHIADVTTIDPGVPIPDDCGFFFAFGVGWLRGVFYDYSPATLGQPRRTYDVKTVLGAYYSYLLFYERYKIDPDTWTAMLFSGWFPFIGLSEDTVRQLVAWCSGDDPSPDEVLPAAVKDVRSALPRWKLEWAPRPFLGDHIELLQRGIERFEAEDYVSAGSILLPRIEGILRSIDPESQAADHHHFVARATGSRPKESALLPKKFRRYLTHVYFRPSKIGPSFLGRNSVGHGVARATSFDQKSCILALLTIDHLVYYLTAESAETAKDDASVMLPSLPPEAP